MYMFEGADWVSISRSSGQAGADPGILERGARYVRGRSPEPSAEGASAGGGLPPPENFEKVDAISCNLAYIFGIRMASDIIQNWAFAEEKTVAATISIHTHTHTHFQKLLGFRPL